MSQLDACLTGKFIGSDVQQCIHNEMDRTWFRMERVYTDLLHRLAPRQARALEREQKAWAAAREPKCANEELREDVLMCLVQQNKRRTEQLERWLKSAPRELRRP